MRISDWSSDVCSSDLPYSALSWPSASKPLAAIFDDSTIASILPLAKSLASSNSFVPFSTAALARSLKSANRVWAWAVVFFTVSSIGLGSLSAAALAANTDDSLIVAATGGSDVAGAAPGRFLGADEGFATGRGAREGVGEGR